MQRTKKLPRRAAFSILMSAPPTTLESSSPSSRHMRPPCNYASSAAAFSLRIAPHRQTLPATDTMPPHCGPALGSTSFWGVYGQSSGNYTAEVSVADIRVWTGTSPPWKRPHVPTTPLCGGLARLRGAHSLRDPLLGEKAEFLATHGWTSGASERAMAKWRLQHPKDVEA
jgi:hypothetical protein